MKRLTSIIFCFLLIHSVTHARMGAADTDPPPMTDTSLAVTNQQLTQLQAQIKALQTQQQQQISTLNTQVQTQLKQIQTELQNQLQTLNKNTQDQIKQVQTTLQNQIMQVQKEKK